MTVEELKNHQVFQIIDQIKNRLEQEDSSEIPGEELEYIFSAIDYFESKFKFDY